MGHTFSHTNGKSAAYLLLRSGSYYYNRRVPKHAVATFGPAVRIFLHRDVEKAAELSASLTQRLDTIWGGENISRQVDVPALLSSCKPRQVDLTEWMEEYAEVRDLQRVPLEVAVRELICLVGDKDIITYDREDARAFIRHLQAKGNTTATIRRRVGSLSAVFNHAFTEMEIDKRNPFSRLIIGGEGKDAKTRVPFTLEELEAGYEEVFASGSPIRLLMPLLGETGCRLGEIVGLRLEDVDLDGGMIRVVPHDARRLKTRGSEREIPLVGHARFAMEQVVGNNRTDGYLYDRYLRDGEILCTHASNALSKWLKKRFEASLFSGGTYL